MCAIREDGAAQSHGSRPPQPSTEPVRRAELDRLLKLAVRDTGMAAGAVFLLASDGQALRLEVTTGIPVEYLAPWFGVALSSPVPMAEAVRERRLVWLGDPEGLARRYPRTAIALPYRHAVAAAPILTGTTVWGALLLLWPGSDTAGPAGPSPEQVRAAARRLGRFLRDAADTGHAVTPGPAPRSLPPAPARERGPAEALAAADFAERLPGGSCGLDLEGRFTYVSATAAALLDSSVADLIGTRPWHRPGLRGPLPRRRGQPQARPLHRPAPAGSVARIRVVPRRVRGQRPYLAGRSGRDLPGGAPQDGPVPGPADRPGRGLPGAAPGRRPLRSPRRG
ncbi:GAF domain-containing protein [Streptomyces sp. NPDC004393]